MRYVVETRKSPEQAVSDLREAVEAHGFGVLHTYDLQATLHSKGFELPNACHILEICNPQQAVNVLGEDMGMNIALPCRVSVYTEGGVTKIATAEPTKLLAALSDSPALRRVAEEVEEKIKSMIDAAV
ncbi:MAG: DUF302 domain-containing protein [Planctomycetes bacterium]|nr:DUF302 domain-containing protein [Planctomycetota bacterium]MCB9904354.1 DUF302 domain-containing protein [Planctomycetota bacterium]